MFMLYWVEDDQLCHKYFEGVGIAEVFKEMEKLRAQRRAGYKISHIAMSQEDPNMVGEMGADIVKGGKLPSGEKYTWVKRRKEVFTENT